MTPTIENRKYWLLIVIVALLTGACQGEPGNEIKSVRLGVAKQPSSALVHVALSAGFFKQEGLEVEVAYYPSGRRALLDGFLKGRVDYLAVSDVPFVYQTFKNDNMVALASLYTTDNINRIVARRDRGISQLSDLEGKSIATQKNSAVHYFLHSVMISNGISDSSTRVSFYPAEELPELLHSGEIDAFSMREPYVSQAKDLLGDNAVILPAPGVYVQSELLVTDRKTLERDREIARRLVRALSDAELFVLHEPGRAIDILADALEVDPEGISKIWKSFDLEITLSQSLLLQMEQLGQWVIDERGLQRTIPDYLEHIEPAVLKEIRPENVTLVH